MTNVLAYHSKSVNFTKKFYKIGPRYGKEKKSNILSVFPAFEVSNKKKISIFCGRNYKTFYGSN